MTVFRESAVSVREPLSLNCGRRPRPNAHVWLCPVRGATGNNLRWFSCRMNNTARAVFVGKMDQPVRICIGGPRNCGEMLLVGYWRFGTTQHVFTGLLDAKTPQVKCVELMQGKLPTIPSTAHDGERMGTLTIEFFALPDCKYLGKSETGFTTEERLRECGAIFVPEQDQEMLVCERQHKKWVVRSLKKVGRK